MNAPRRLAADPGLLRGEGPGLGPLARRFPFEERTLLHVLAAQVRERPDQDWLVFDATVHLTFRAAQEESYRFAAALCSHALGRPATVALLLRNQREFMPAFLGAQAAGGVAAPLNPELRGPLLETVLRRCEAGVLVVRDELVEVLDTAPSLAGVTLVLVAGGAGGRTTVHGVPVVELGDWLRGHAPDPPAVFPSPSDLAVLMFTSGTSGGSKAAMWSHHYLYLASAGVSDTSRHGSR